MADIDFKNSVNVDTAYVDGHKVKLIAVPDGSLELPISANDEYGYVVDANGKKHRVLLVTFLEGEPDYKQSPTADTAYMTVNSQKVKVRLGAKLNGTQYLSDSANVNDCYTEDDDSNKHRTILVSEPTGTLELPTSETSDSAYVIDNDGNKHKVRLFAVLAGGTTIVEVTVSGVPPLNLLGAVEDSLSSVKAYGGTEQRNIPQPYTQVNYVTNTASTAVDTGIMIDFSKNYEFEVECRAVSGSWYILQSRASASGNVTGIHGETSGSTIKLVVGNVTVCTSAITRTVGNKLYVKATLNAGTATLYVKDETANTEDTQTGSYGTTQPNPTAAVYLLGNAGGQYVDVNSDIYMARIKENDTVVMDYVPARQVATAGFYDTASGTFKTALTPANLSADGNTVPTPSNPMDLVCNNGTLKILDKSDWTIFTNPTSIAGQGVFINSTGKWQAVGDRGAGCAIPLTIGKQYTLVIHKKTVSLGQMLRYGQSPQITPTSAGVQLTDWYRGGITDGQMISFVAKQPYFVMQLGADPTEAGMIQEAIEVLEAQGGDYTFLKYIEATGTQYIDTGLSGAMRWVGAGQGTSESSGSKVIVSSKATTGDDIKGAVIWLGSRCGNTDAGKHWTLGGTTGNISISNVGTTTFAKYDVTFADDKFTGKINDEILGTVINSWSINEWRIGASFANITGNPAYYFIGNIYRQQAYQNGVLVGDFIPAIRNSDNVVGMYDTVSGTFFENAGTGTFVAGTPLGDGEVLKLTPSNDTAGVANLFKIDNYVDTQEILTGLINHQLGIYVFDGTEDWTWSSGANAPARLNIPEVDYVLNTDVAPVMCSHFMPTFWNNLSPTTKTTPYVAINQTNQPAAKRIVFTAAWDANITDAESWKTFLAGQYSAGTPVIVVYPLATAQDEVAPIPQTMQTVAGDNTLDIVQAGMSGLEVSATYMKGVSVTITEIEDANIGNSVEVVIA